jgi:membrane protein DedA with SNARE-associated domain
MIAPALIASTAIILFSFVSEDAATISSSLSVFGGPLSWPFSFASCFAGIWLGDLGLYSLARYAGKSVLHSRWFTRWADPATVSQCEQSFEKNSAFALVASRFIPGTRLPTYLAAGLFAMPVRRFALITALGALVWISAIFVLTKLLGTQALAWFAFGQSKIAVVVFTAALLLGAAFVLKKFAAGSVRLRRWRHWEFWPAWLFYLPVGVYYVWLSLRHRSFTLPTAANPGIPTGGFVGESKVEILRQLQEVDAGVVADAHLLEGWTSTDRLLSLHRFCRQHSITLPFILKPDVGQRGNGVRLITSMREAFDYLIEVDAPIILQRYASGRQEAGVFYFRIPGQVHGQIFSITEKVFPTVTGDGVRTIEQLIRADARASLIANTYLRRFADRKGEILPAAEMLRLVETGNHAQGCIFRDGGHLWSEELEGKIDDLSRQLPDFYFGRFDIRYDNEQHFRAGQNFKIVELNGSSSEATSIYDARNSLRSAYKTLFRQWRLVFEIGAANRARGCAPSRLRTLWQEWRRYSAAALSYPSAS